MRDQSRVRPLLRVPLHFEAVTGESVHAPMVLATVGAINTRFIVDTGSDVHLLTAELASAAGLALTSVDVGLDHAGSELESRLVGDVSIRLDEATGSNVEIPLHDVVAIPAPAAFAAHGIGGILSPQRLHVRAFAIIDEIDNELALIDAGPEDLRAWLLERHPTPAVLSLERRAGDDRPIVDAALEPHPPLPILINTGGRHTEFAPDSVPGLAGGELERIGTGVSGEAVMGAAAGSQVLRLGDHRVALPSVMLRTGMEDPAAMLGQDVLRGTVVVVGPDTTKPVMWQVEETGDELEGDRVVGRLWVTESLAVHKPVVGV